MRHLLSPAGDSREHAVRCPRCQAETWNVCALCDRCCSHAAESLAGQAVASLREHLAVNDAAPRPLSADGIAWAVLTTRIQDERADVALMVRSLDAALAEHYAATVRTLDDTIAAAVAR